MMHSVTMCELSVVCKKYALGRFPRILRVSLGMSLKAPKRFPEGKPEADRPKVFLRIFLMEPSDSSCGKL